MSADHDSPSWQRYLTIAFILLAVVLVVRGLQGAVEAGWFTIVQDQWGIYDQLLHEPGWDGVLGSHNGHRTTVPRLFFLADLFVFGGHNIFLTVVGLLLAAASVAALLLPLRAASQMPGWVRIIAGCFLCMFWFWLRNIRILCHGNESVHAYLVTLGLAVGAVLVARGQSALRAGETPSVTGAVLLACCCFVGTFSFGVGIVLWPAFLITLAVLKFPRTWLLVLVAPFVATLFAYMFLLPGSDEVGRQLGFAPTRTVPDTCMWVGSPAYFIAAEWWAALFGTETPAILRSVAGAVGLCMIGGVIVATLRLLRVRREAYPLEAAFVPVTLFGVGCGALIALGRVKHLGEVPEGIIAVRYQVWTSVLWSGAAVLLAHYLWVIRATRRLQRVWIVGVCLLALLFVPQAVTAPSYYAAQARGHERAALGILVGVEDDAEVRAGLGMNPAIAYRVRPTLQEHGASVFAWPEASWLSRVVRLPTADSENASAGVVTQITPVSNEGTRFEGWAVIPPSQAAAAIVVAVDANDRVVGVARMTEERPDVARHLGIGHARIGFFGYYMLEPGQVTPRFVAFPDLRDHPSNKGLLLEVATHR
ncbi:MAG: hypothetical protein AAF581_01785 [Planctomycetota bacterium]